MRVLSHEVSAFGWAIMLGKQLTEVFASICLHRGAWIWLDGWDIICELACLFSHKKVPYRVRLGPAQEGKVRNWSWWPAGRASTCFLCSL